MAIFRVKGRRGGEIFGGIVKYIVDHPRSTLKDVAAFLKEEYKLDSEDDRARIGEYASQTFLSAG